MIPRSTIAVSVATAVMCAAPAFAEIISVSSTGPGGTTPLLNIGTLVSPDDTINFINVYTADAPIVFTLKIQGGGRYFIGDNFEGLENETDATIHAFEALLFGAPGAAIVGASWSTGWNAPTPVPGKLGLI